MEPEKKEMLGYTKGNKETEKEKRYKAAKKPIANNWNDENYKGWTSLGHTRELTHAYPHISMIA